MNKNCIHYIAPTAFSDLSSLRELNMDDNQLTTLSAELLEPLLSSIHMINVRHNRLRHVIHDYRNSFGNRNTVKCGGKGE